MYHDSGGKVKLVPSLFLIPPRFVGYKALLTILFATYAMRDLNAALYPLIVMFPRPNALILRTDH
jgi:hypothetical protein